MAALPAVTTTTRASSQALASDANSLDGLRRAAQAVQRIGIAGQGLAGRSRGGGDSGQSGHVR